MKYTNDVEGREDERVGRGSCFGRVLLSMKEKDIEVEVERKDNFPPSGSLNTKPPTLLLLLL